MDLSKENNLESSGVYELITKLCERTAAKYCFQNRLSQKLLTAKLRSQAYEIILKKSSSEDSSRRSDPIVNLLSHNFISEHNVKNVAEYKRCVELKKCISTLRSTDFGDKKEHINNVLKFLIELRNSSKQDLSAEMFHVRIVTIILHHIYKLQLDI